MKYYLLNILLLIGFSITAQDVIRLENASFEDLPMPGKTPAGWTNCGSTNYSPPDIHPDFTRPIFGVRKEAYDGNTYLGMVVRDDNTNDALGQKLVIPLQGKQCYVMNAFLSLSFDYESVSPKTGEFVFYKAPVRVVLWGGYEHCNKQEILAQTPPIENLEWKDFQFFFQPSKTFTHLTIEAYYVGNDGVAYNGNVLVDFISPIIAANCDTGQESAKPQERTKTAPKDDKLPNKIILSDLAALKTYLQQESPNIQLSKADAALNSSTQQALTNIGQAKLSFGQYRLVLLLTETNSALFLKQVNKINAVFKEALIPKTTYQVINEEQGVNKVDWVAESAKLKVGLVKKFSLEDYQK